MTTSPLELNYREADLRIGLGGGVLQGQTDMGGGEGGNCAAGMNCLTGFSR